MQLSLHYYIVSSYPFGKYSLWCSDGRNSVRACVKFVDESLSTPSFWNGTEQSCMLELLYRYIVEIKGNQKFITNAESSHHAHLIGTLNAADNYWLWSNCLAHPHNCVIINYSRLYTFVCLRIREISLCHSLLLLQIFHVHVHTTSTQERFRHAAEGALTYIFKKLFARPEKLEVADAKSPHADTQRRRFGDADDVCCVTRHRSVWRLGFVVCIKLVIARIDWLSNCTERNGEIACITGNEVDHKRARLLLGIHFWGSVFIYAKLMETDFNEYKSMWTQLHSLTHRSTALLLCVLSFGGGLCAAIW